MTVAIVAIIIILILASGNKSNQASYTLPQKTIQQNMAVPNPESANPKDVARFILNHDKDIVKQVYTQFRQKGIIIPKQLENLFQSKMNGGFILYSKVYNELNISAYQAEKENLQQYPDEYTFDVKGLHVKSYQDRLSECAIYDRVTLKRDPGNKYDSNAIKVMAGSGMIGHVPADQTEEVGEIIQGDYRAFIAHIFDFDRVDADIIIYYDSEQKKVISTPDLPKATSKPKGKSYKEAYEYKEISADFLTQNLDGAPPENPFYDKKVVFTGDLQEWDRPTVCYLLQKLGADVNTSISGRTNIVVIGKGAGPSKMEKITDLLAKGSSLRVMNEEVFKKEVEPYLHLIGIS